MRLNPTDEDRPSIGRQRIDRVRRAYNKWAADETLEDFALRFTAVSARRWSAVQVGQTALGAVSFLALEAIGGSVTLNYGFTNAAVAIAATALVIFATALPICICAAKAGVDIDLLTRGAGFGYIGSTVTSLIYASFTFLFFAIESAIMATALKLCLGFPLPVGYLLSAVLVIPLVIYGIAAISRFQIWTQPIFIALNILPIAALVVRDPGTVAHWLHYSRDQGTGHFALASCGAAASVVVALIVQVGEQVDYLRFLPERAATPKTWWLALVASGPGWIGVGALKLLAGSFLAVVLVDSGLPLALAADPSRMYAHAFAALVGPGSLALALSCALVVLCQLKINITNAYAGSIAWSNFFARLTRMHPGRVVWLVFNVVVALLIMELGVYDALEQTLSAYSILATAWVGALVADIVINKPLGFSPPGIEFKRAHLFDVNPVGVGAMATAVLAGALAKYGCFGSLAGALAPFVALAVSLLTAPAIAWATDGRYYLARRPSPADEVGKSCCICENAFEPEDMAHCPAYAGSICSLCCSLDTRCHDRCKPTRGLQDQLAATLTRILPAPAQRLARPAAVDLFLTFLLFGCLLAFVLAIVGLQLATNHGIEPALLRSALWRIFFSLLIVAGVASWWLHLNRLSRRAAEDETMRQTDLLMAEIEAHERTDAALKRAKEAAESANLAKSRYVVGLSHELRTPLNAIMGYAQLVERDAALPAKPRSDIAVIRRNANHLAGLIDGLLDISKIEAGKLDLARDEVALAPLLAQITDTFALQADAKGIGFGVTVAPNLPEVVATDQKRLRQILINLLSNAIKFTQSGRVDLDVTYRNQVADFRVSDTGPGIAPENHERIFEPFARFAVAEPGTGLGLTICRLLSNVMGGDLDVTSALAAGSTFRLRLFMPALPARIVPPPSARRVATYGAGHRALVVDDNEAHRALIASALEPAGFEVHGAASVAGGLVRADELAPTLFILDIELPDGSGWQLADALRNKGHVGAPIIILSATAAEARHATSAPPIHDAFLMKPIDLERLEATIVSLLRLDAVVTGAAPATTKKLEELPGDALPRRDDLDRLVELCGLGFVRGLRETLATIAEDERKRPFVDLIAADLDAVDLRSLRRKLNSVAELIA